MFATEGYPDPAEERAPDRPALTPEQQSLYRQDIAVPDILQYLISAKQEANSIGSSRTDVLNGHRGQIALV